MCPCVLSPVSRRQIPQQPVSFLVCKVVVDKMCGLVFWGFLLWVFFFWKKYLKLVKKHLH